MNPALIFLLYIFAVLGQFSDDRTTEVALQHGFVEGNPIGKFLLAHLGTTGLYAFKTGALPIATAILAATIFPRFGAALQVFVGVLGLGLGIRNYLLMSKSGIKFSEIF